MKTDPDPLYMGASDLGRNENDPTPSIKSDELVVFGPSHGLYSVVLLLLPSSVRHAASQDRD